SWRRGKSVAIRVRPAQQRPRVCWRCQSTRAVLSNWQLPALLWDAWARRKILQKLLSSWRPKIPAGSPVRNCWSEGESGCKGRTYRCARFTTFCLVDLFDEFGSGRGEAGPSSSCFHSRCSRPQLRTASFSGRTVSPWPEMEYSTRGGTSAYTVRQLSSSCSRLRIAAANTLGESSGLN